ncbi:hypothetical protein C8R46DRAFT_1224310 [Mycena filopes]|nr:hypothetical protein C8R46DRAFT_1224310 [Mycena filopes]
MSTYSEYQPNSFRPSPPGSGPVSEATGLPVQPHGYPNFGYFDVSSGVDPAAHYSSQSTTAPEEFLQASLMAQQYLDFPIYDLDIQQGTPYSRSNSSASSYEAADTSHNSSPYRGMSSTQSSSGYGHEFPDSALSGYPPAHNYSDYRHHDDEESSTSLGSSPAFQNPPIQRPPNDWGYDLPSPIPSTSLSSRFPRTRPSSLTSSGFTQFSAADGWPQMFKITPMRKFEPKKPRLSCFFCRERKIGCTRPEVDAADQPCNQCVRRKRQFTTPSLP